MHKIFKTGLKTVPKMVKNDLKTQTKLTETYVIIVMAFPKKDMIRKVSERFLKFAKKHCPKKDCPCKFATIKDV